VQASIASALALATLQNIASAATDGNFFHCYRNANVSVGLALGGTVAQKVIELVDGRID
jgi:hypothetical protein